MNEQTKLILALNQIENVTSLMKNNEYEQYFYIRLIQMQVELKRQLTNLNSSTKLKE
jgi:hypothetical protein